MSKKTSSIYPLTPADSRVLFRAAGSYELSRADRAVVALSSICFVGSIFWVPIFYGWLWKKWSNIPKEDKKRRALYAALLIALAGLVAKGPHRSVKAGERMNVRKWSLWRAWLNYLSIEIVSDQLNTETPSLATKMFDAVKDQAILAVVPHGIFPFALAFAALPEETNQYFGRFRPVVATATALFPFVRDFLSMLGAVDASRSAVDRALSDGSRIGLAPGGIAEMFEGYPKPNTQPHEEYAILNSRKGFIRMAMKHGIPVIPIYCFGAKQTLKRLQLPNFVESVSNILRISICLFFGPWGLPMPFRQRLLYIIGKPIFPPQLTNMETGSENIDMQVNEMHKRFCDQLLKMFDKHKESYGWGHKELKII